MVKPDSKLSPEVFYIMTDGEEIVMVHLCLLHQSL